MKQSVQKIVWSLAFQGSDPEDVPRDVLFEMVRVPDWSDPIEIAARNQIENPLTAIRAMCIICQGGSIVGARMCEKTNCPLWIWRLGTDVLSEKATRGKVKLVAKASTELDALEADERQKQRESA